MIMKKENKTTAAEKNKRIRKKVLLLILSFILQFGLYILLLVLGTAFHELFYTIGFTAYLTAGAIVLVAYYVMNGATFSSSSSADVRRIDSTYADKLERSKEKAKKLHFILLPMAVLLLLIFADMYFGETMKNLFG